MCERQLQTREKKLAIRNVIFPFAWNVTEILNSAQLIRCAVQCRGTGKNVELWSSEAERKFDGNHCENNGFIRCAASYDRPREKLFFPKQNVWNIYRRRISRSRIPGAIFIVLGEKLMRKKPSRRKTASEFHDETSTTTLVIVKSGSNDGKMHGRSDCAL